MSRTLILLLLGTLCGAVAAWLSEPDADARLSAAALRLQHRLEAAAHELAALAEQETSIIASEGAHAWLIRRSTALEAERQRTGTRIRLCTGDSLVAWTGDLADAPDQACQPAAEPARWLSATVQLGELSLIAERPIWQIMPVQNPFLHDGFHPSLDVPEGLVASAPSAIGEPVHDLDGSVRFRVRWREGALELGGWLWYRALFIALAAILLLTALWQWCSAMLLRGASWSGAAIFIGLLVGSRWLTLSIGPVAPFDRWPLFDPVVYASSAWQPSLGDLLINTGLLAFIGTFLLRLARLRTWSQSWQAIAFRFGLLLLFGHWITRLCIDLVDNSTIDLDLYHIQGLGLHGIVALVIVAGLMGAWGMAALALLRTLPHPMGTAALLRGIATPTVLSIVIHHLLGYRDTILFLWPVAAWLVLGVRRAQRIDFLRGVLLLALIAGTSTHIITKYMSQREHREREVLAERIALREDPVVEQLFRESAPVIRRDTVLYALLSGKAFCDAGDLARLVREPYFSGYWERYDLRLFAYAPNGELRCASDLDPPRDAGNPNGPYPTGITDMPELFFDERMGGDIYYHARIAIMPHDSVAPAQLLVELKPRSLSQGIGFPDLLLAGNDELGRRAERYVQARYVGGLLMDQRGSMSLPQHWALDPPAEEWFVRGDAEYLAKSVGSNVVMVLGLPYRGAMDKATTFSYLFTFFGLLLLLALAIHALIRKSLPDMGIGTKVRAALVLFAIIGLVFFGAGSQRLLSRQFDERQNALTLEKARSVAQELRRRIGDERIDQPLYAQYLQYLLGQLGNTYLTDLALYAPDGRWLASSRPQMFTSGLLGPRMPHQAFARLALEGSNADVVQQHVGSAAFSTAFMPLLSSEGQLLAYLALPSFADRSRQAEERAQLLVAVVNLFVLLFALSVLLAVFISNWTTRPLDVLKRALAGVALRGSNQPIHYRGKDEVGELVAVYNQKVEELRESAERLARSERESAWREMARQVAHEVKNPLTPMKLGIQHFQYTFDPQAPDAKERLDRFAKSMVEQIDTLNGVASAFSQFAQMPAAAPTELDLCEAVRSAVDVFHASPGITITHHEEGPLPVLADREHMLRVLNNLLKNAVQAMPEDHDGRIEVIARREGSRARIEVRDNGTGIPAEARERIFTPSFTTKSSGMGLGLAMVKRMVEQAGGRVWFESEEGQGTRFFVELPLHR